MHINWSIHPENPRKLQIIVDEEPWKEIDKYLFVRDLSSLRRAKDKKELQELFTLIEEKAAKKEALRLLAQRSHFAEELFKKIQSKGLSSTAIQTALIYCQKLGYLNEQDKTASFVEREKRKGMGPKLIALKLKAKGVKTTVAQGTDEQLTAIKKLIEKRYANKEKHKVYQALMRRGFDDEAIRESLKYFD